MRDELALPDITRPMEDPGHARLSHTVATTPMPAANSAVARYQASSPRLRRIVLAEDAAKLEDSSAVAVAQRSIISAPAFASGAARGAKYLRNFVPLRRMVLAEDLARLKDSRVIALAHPSIRRAPPFATGTARRTASQDCLADPPLLPGRRRRTRTTTRPRPARTAMPPPKLSTLQSEPFWRTRVAFAAGCAGGCAALGLAE